MAEENLTGRKEPDPEAQTVNPEGENIKEEGCTVNPEESGQTEPGGEAPKEEGNTGNPEEADLIRIRWHVDRTKDPCVYMLVCLNPEYPDLTVSISSAEVTERVAKARLMEQMYNLGAERGIRAKRLRFKINGIEE
ncbi:MAG: hypothetical protein K5922_03205 [Clostridiales bacterium]|nr:hypothetical protein [Clostridiales bacterium]